MSHVGAGWKWTSMIGRACLFEPASSAEPNPAIESTNARTKPTPNQRNAVIDPPFVGIDPRISSHTPHTMVPCAIRAGPREKSRENAEDTRERPCYGPSRTSGGSMARIHLALFGTFQARVEPETRIALPTRKSQALLAYLAFPPGRAHGRDKLASLLWGDMADREARGG